MVAGRRLSFLLVLAVAISGLQAGAAAADPAEPPVTRPAQIDRNGVLILVRTTLSALDQANKTGNYTVFRDLAAPSFSTFNDAAKLGEIFASQRHGHLDLSGVLVLDPQLTVLPELDEAGRMRLAGFFPSVPTQVNFRLQYEPINGQWRLGEIGVNIGSSAPVAPAPPPPPPAAAPPPPATAKAPQATKGGTSERHRSVHAAATTPHPHKKAAPADVAPAAEPPAPSR